MIILVRTEDVTSAREVWQTLERTANFKPIRTLRHNGLSYIETVVVVPDKTTLRGFLRSLKAVCNGVQGVSLDDTNERMVTHGT